MSQKTVTTKVTDLKPGDKIQDGAIVLHVRSIKANASGVVVSKQPSGSNTFSIDSYGPQFEDLHNRVEVVA